MRPPPIPALVLAAALALALPACQLDSRKQLLATEVSSVELRSMQTRAFDTTDEETTLRTVIATLQDLGFVIDRADLDLGLVTGTKVDHPVQMRATVTVRPRGETQLLVRANAQTGTTLEFMPTEAVVDPEAYQAFFTSLEQAMFLKAHEVD